jgi:hypothetical protein
MISSVLASARALTLRLPRGSFESRLISCRILTHLLWRRGRARPAAEVEFGKRLETVGDIATPGLRKFGSPLANPRPGLDNGPQRNFSLPSTRPLNKIAAIVKLTRSKRGGWLLKSTIVVKQLVHAQGNIGDRFDCEGMPPSPPNLYRFGDFKSLHVGDV